LLFAIVMDWIIKKSLRNYEGGLEWTDGSRLCDLEHADDIYSLALIETLQTGMQHLTREIERTLGSIGLCMNAKNIRLWPAMIGKTIQQ